MASEDFKLSKKELKRKHDIVVDDKPKIKKEPAMWSDEEDEILRDACSSTDVKDIDWKDLCNKLNNKSYTQALHRWQKVLDPKLVKGSWSQEEDETLKQLVAKLGPKNWSVIASNLNGRIGKQCRERWYNHLAPEIRKDPWTTQEDKIILDFHSKFGNKWSDLAKLLPGRPSNAIKNHWNSTLRRRVQETEEVRSDSSSRSKKLKKTQNNVNMVTEPLCNEMYNDDMSGFFAVKKEETSKTWGSNSSFENLIDAPLVSVNPCNPSNNTSVSELFNNTFAQIESELIDDEWNSNNNWMEDSERADYNPNVLPNMIDLGYNTPMMNPYYQMQQQFVQMPMGMMSVEPNFYYNGYGQVAPMVYANQFGLQNNFQIFNPNQAVRMTF